MSASQIGTPPTTGRRPPARPLAVARVLGSLDTGGTELRALEIAPRLREAGVVTHFVTITGRRGANAAAAERAGAHVHPLPLDPSFPVRFVRLLRRLGIRAVHADVHTFSGAILLLAAIAGVPARIAYFQSDGDGWPDTVRRRAQRAVMRKLISTFATDIRGVAPGSLTGGYGPAWPSDPRCRVLPTGPDVRRLRRLPQSDLRAEVGAAPEYLLCLFVGRPDPVKRRPMLPRIVAALEARGVRAHVVIAGPHERDADEEVRRTARTHHVEDRVHLLGARDDIGALLRQADVMIHPASREGLPGVVLEAVATGTPVVATDLPGVRYIDDELGGVSLVDVDAPPEVWAERVVCLAPAPGRERDVESALRRYEASSFAPEALRREFLAMYRAPVDDGAAHH
ncbi:glycosyltransferase family 4 protein [Micromonospora schwarzwaldensis]|uniref:glycosyltransferase family 4 protein n=1 Tax=Micromonospora sp. DSM 45708 TaxID=3111767 RepID=UPI0031DC93FA